MTQFQLNLIMHGKIYAFARRKTKEKSIFLSQSRCAAIYLFEYLTRSSNNLSQLANQKFLKDILSSLLLLRRFFSASLVLWFTRNRNVLLLWLLLLINLFFYYFNFVRSKQNQSKKNSFQIAEILAHAKTIAWKIHKFVRTFCGI